MHYIEQSVHRRLAHFYKGQSVQRHYVHTLCRTNYTQTPCTCNTCILGNLLTVVINVQDMYYAGQ